MQKTLFRRILAAMLVSLTLAGCASVPSDTPDTGTPSAESKGTGEPGADSKSNADSTPVTLAAAGREPQTVALDAAFLQGVNDFSTELFHKSLTPGKNLVLSPYSVYNLLAILANGASGDTAAALSDVLGYDDILALDDSLYSAKESLAGTGVTEIANGIWLNGDIGFTLNDDYAATVKRYFDAQSMPLSFSDAKSVGEINRWISDATHGMIPETLKELSPDAAAILANTVYFNGKWVIPYDEWSVTDDTFHGYAGDTTASFMHSKEYSYFTVDGGVGFTKEYENGYTFIAVLPDDDVYDFAAALSVDTLLAARDTANENREKVLVSLPKFDYDADIPLADTLSDMGLSALFSPGVNLTGIGEDGAGNSAYVSDMFQKAKIRTDEGGTEAAAVTVAVMECMSLMPEEPKEIVFDRPFVYAILTPEGLPLFLGVLANID